MNKRGEVGFDLEEPATWAAMGLAILGAVGAWWYTGYLGTGASIVTKIISAILTAVIGYFVAMIIMTR